MFITGPCSLTSYELGLEEAKAAKSLGATYFRAGCYKPRTYPNTFQGLRNEGLEILCRIRQEVGIKVITEVVEAEEVKPYLNDIDMIQIGSRNCQNFELLKTVSKWHKPVLLKRGFGMKIEELYGAAAYLRDASEVVLCERGIRTFETLTRNTIDYSLIPITRHRGLPYKVIIDPSHGVGISQYVLPMAQAALAAGADGVMIEATFNPSNSPTDAMQMVTFEQLKKLVGWASQHNYLDELFKD